MEKQRLLETLAQLHAELAQTDRVDPEMLARLEDVTRDVHKALDEHEERADEEIEPVTGLRDLLLKYEADHPQLSAAVGRVADALAAMGF